MMMTVGGASGGIGGSAAAGVVQYTGTLDAFKKVIAAEGMQALFRGAGANILRCVTRVPLLGEERPDD